MCSMDYFTLSKISESLLWTLNEAVASDPGLSLLEWNLCPMSKLEWRQSGPQNSLPAYLECSCHPMGGVCVEEGSPWPFDHTHQEFRFFSLEGIRNAVTCPSQWSMLTPDGELRGEGAPFLSYTLPELNLHQAELRTGRRGNEFWLKATKFLLFLLRFSRFSWINVSWFALCTQEDLQRR